MKKLLLTIATAMLCLATASAQGFLTFRIEAGPGFSFSQFSAAITNSNYDLLSKKTNVGYHVGAYADLNVLKGLYLSSGLTFAMKGSKATAKVPKNLLGYIGLSNETEEQEIDITLHYLQIPVNLGYKLSISPSLKLGIQTGPYFAVALAGTQQSKIPGVNTIQSFNVFKDGVLGLSKMKRFDIGWDAAAMVYISSLYATVGADFGLLNVATDDNDAISKTAQQLSGLSFKNSTVYVGLGLCF